MSKRERKKTSYAAKIHIYNFYSKNDLRLNLFALSLLFFAFYSKKPIYEEEADKSQMRKHAYKRINNAYTLNRFTNSYTILMLVPKKAVYETEHLTRFFLSNGKFSTQWWCGILAWLYLSTEKFLRLKHFFSPKNSI